MSYQCEGHIKDCVITEIKFKVATHNDLAHCAKEATFFKDFMFTANSRSFVVSMSDHYMV